MTGRISVLWFSQGACAGSGFTCACLVAGQALCLPGAEGGCELAHQMVGERSWADLASVIPVRVVSAASVESIQG
jgi:hypothetical protein